MRSAKINYVLVGLFVIVMGVALATAVVMLSGGGGATDSYHAIYRNVTGVKYGTQILYEGYPIGQVEAVTPEPEGGGMRFRVDFTVTHGWRIPSDSVASIEAPGLLSAIVIAVSEGASTKPLKPGDRIESREAENLFTVVASVADQVKDIASHDLKPLLATINESAATFNDVLGGQGKKLVGQMGDLATDLSKRIPLLIDDVESVTAQLRTTSIQLEKLFSESNRKSVESMLDKTNNAITSFGKVAGDLNSTRENVDRILKTVDNMLTDNKLDIETAIIDLRHVVDTVARHIDALNQNMEGAARNMNEFSRQIRQNPGLLLGGKAPPDQASGN